MQKYKNFFILERNYKELTKKRCAKLQKTIVHTNLLVLFFFLCFPLFKFIPLPFPSPALLSCAFSAFLQMLFRALRQ